MRIGTARTDADNITKAEQVCIKEWYYGDWDIYIEPLNRELAERAAGITELICQSKSFGYSQPKRWSGYYSILSNNRQIKGAEGYFDCSSLVIAAYLLAGLKVDPEGYTGNLHRIFERTGLFRIHSGRCLADGEYGIRGGIYIRKSEHTVMCLDNGSKSSPVPEELRRMSEIRYKEYLAERKRQSFETFKKAVDIIRSGNMEMLKHSQDGIFDMFGELKRTPRNPDTKLYGLIDGKLVDIDSQYSYISLPDIPKDIVRCYIKYEDVNFYRHKGFDVRGIIRAAANNLVGRPVQGASTISMQLAKLLFLRYKRTMSFKIRQLLLAVLMERHFSKEQILELYFNSLFFTSGIYGLEAAARFYLGKSASGITLPEFVFLACIAQKPAWCDPLRHPENNRYYRKVWYTVLCQNGIVSQREYESGIAFEPKLVCDREQLHGRTAHYEDIYTVTFDKKKEVFSANAERVYKILEEERFSASAIAGIMGNIHVESAFKPDVISTVKGNDATGFIQWDHSRLEQLKQAFPTSWKTVSSQLEFLMSEMREGTQYTDPRSVIFRLSALRDGSRSPEYYADLFQALVERNVNIDTLDCVLQDNYYAFAGRFPKQPNRYDGKYYLDADIRRNYARLYYNHLIRRRRMDNDIRIDRALLHPHLDHMLGIMIKECNREGIYLIITEGYRTKEYQDELYAQGRTKDGNIVTAAQGRLYQSQHQWGIAFDIAIKNTGHTFDMDYIRKVADITKTHCKSLGWGGDWEDFPDYLHFYLKKWGENTSILKEQFGTPENFMKTWKNEVFGNE